MDLAYCYYNCFGLFMAGLRNEPRFPFYRNKKHYCLFKILNLPETINMITYNPAKATGLKNRGAFLPGNYADVVIFKLKDKIPEISKVFVNGRNVYSYGK